METNLKQINLHLEDFLVVNLNLMEDYSELQTNNPMDYLVNKHLLEVFLDKLLLQHTVLKQIYLEVCLEVLRHSNMETQVLKHMIKWVDIKVY